MHFWPFITVWTRKPPHIRLSARRFQMTSWECFVVMSGVDDFWVVIHWQDYQKDQGSTSSWHSPHHNFRGDDKMNSSYTDSHLTVWAACILYSASSRLLLRSAQTLALLNRIVLSKNQRCHYRHHHDNTEVVIATPVCFSHREAFTPWINSSSSSSSSISNSSHSHPQTHSTLGTPPGILLTISVWDSVCIVLLVSRRVAKRPLN